MLSIARSGLPAWLIADIKHLSSFHNLLFHQRQRLRLSTYQTPRLIKCYTEDLSHLHLPRGLFEQLAKVVEEAGSTLVLTDI